MGIAQLTCLVQETNEAFLNMSWFWITLRNMVPAITDCPVTKLAMLVPIY